MRLFFSLLYLITFLSLPHIHAQTIVSDINSDGCVNLNDMLTLLSEYGQCDEQLVFTCGDYVSHENYYYSTVQIGNQCWFSTNCRYLPSVSPSLSFSSSTPYYYVYGFEGSDVLAAKSSCNYNIYGVLYNGPAVMDPGICPNGWHIATDLEWTELTNFHGGLSVAGPSMMSTCGWNNDAWGTNLSGFNGLPGGTSFPGGFVLDGDDTYWWSSTTSGSSSSWIRMLEGQGGTINRVERNIIYGLSARCIKD
jgi:uncharacterized protein (TIGR02145 family)